jgi:multimeric flavodoxin WrbA
MKVVAFNASPRKDGNTASMIWTVFRELAQEDIEVEMVQLAGQFIFPCRACGGCFKSDNKRCVIEEDIINSCVDKMIEADGIILASPVYFGDVTGQMKMLIDRAGMVSGANAPLFRRKLGAGIIVARRAGAMHAFHTLNSFFLLCEMIVPGSNYWNIGYGRQIGEVTADEEAMKAMEVLGRNMAWLLKKVHG